MTKYSINPELAVPEKEGPKKTVFNRVVGPKTQGVPHKSPAHWDNVQLLWRDTKYGDVFAAWDNDPEDRAIYFGEAGDEFGQLPPKP